MLARPAARLLVMLHVEFGKTDKRFVREASRTVQDVLIMACCSGVPEAELRAQGLPPIVKERLEATFNAEGWTCPDEIKSRLGGAKYKLFTAGIKFKRRSKRLKRLEALPPEEEVRDFRTYYVCLQCGRAVDCRLPVGARFCCKNCGCTYEHAWGVLCEILGDDRGLYCICDFEETSWRTNAEVLAKLRSENRQVVNFKCTPFLVKQATEGHYKFEVDVFREIERLQGRESAPGPRLVHAAGAGRVAPAPRFAAVTPASASPLR